MDATIGLADGHGKNGIGDHPANDHVRAHRLVVIFLHLRFRDRVPLDFEPVAEIAERFVVAGIDVELLAGHFELDRVSLSGDGGAEIGVDDVVAFGAPGNVVGVAKGVHLERADVGGEKGKVLGG